METTNPHTYEYTRNIIDLGCALISQSPKCASCFSTPYLAVHSSGLGDISAKKSGEHAGPSCVCFVSQAAHFDARCPCMIPKAQHARSAACYPNPRVPSTRQASEYHGVDVYVCMIDKNKTISASSSAEKLKQ